MPHRKPQPDREATENDEVQAASHADDGSLAFWLTLDAPPNASQLARLRRVAGRSKWRVVPRRGIVVREGEPGDECYLLARGRVEVLVATDSGVPRSISTLHPGTIIGEGAVLTGERRSATVRALDKCELLTISRAELLDAMRADRQVAIRVLDLLRLRGRPRCAPNIVSYERVDANGEPVTILKDSERGHYYRLSPTGWFLWQRLDGCRTLADLCLDYEDSFKVLAPQVVTEEIDRLERAGFAELPALRPDVKAILDRHVPRWSRVVRGIKRVFEWELVWSGVDPLLTKLYDGGIFLFYTWTAQVVIAATALIGLFVFLMNLGTVGSVLYDLTRAHILLSLLPLFVLTVALHELGHGFTAKAFGREIQRMGVGWDWLVPIVFVDTSDMWLAGRWPRIAVNVAGVYVNVILGSLAALAAWLIPATPASEILWLFAVISYALALINLNPWLDHDGYYVLMDLLDRPDLRRDSFAWIRRDLIPALKSGKGLRGHWADLLYGLGAVAYVALIAALVVIFCLYVVYPWMATILPGAVAIGLAGLLALVVIALAAGGVLGSLFLPSAAERARLRNMQLGAWTAS